MSASWRAAGTERGRPPPALTLGDRPTEMGDNLPYADLGNYSGGWSRRRPIAVDRSRHSRPISVARRSGAVRRFRRLEMLARTMLVWELRETVMRQLIFRRRVWLLVLASAFAAACSRQLAPMQTELPAPCNAAPLADDVLIPDVLSPANGSVTGSDVVARLCDGGASAYLQRTSPTTSPPSQLFVNISSDTVDRTRDFQIAFPADATRLQLGVNVGLNAAQPGVYTEGDTCGSIQVCAIFPAPTSVHCPVTPQDDMCPPGCAGLPPTCAPAEPATCYLANTNPSCNGGTSSAQGSWQLTLSSVEPYTGPESVAPGYDLFVIHGSLDATLVKIDSGSDVDAGATRTSTASLSLRF